ncbi:MAG: hypothetical protein LBU42_01895 [Prevotellaceae bacterium]|nr:hypothetical protein [Prevotellaceae bacterium]
MKNFTIWRNILVLGILLMLSCEEERDSKYPKIMQGQVDFSIPEPAVAGREILFQVSNGIIDPEKNLTFDWSAPDFTPTAYTGENFLATAPATPGIYPIFLTVRAAGYRDVVIKNEVKLELAYCTPMIGSLRIEGPANAYMNEEVVFTAAGIASPGEADLEYRWATSGGFSPGTFTGKEFRTRISDTPNTYTVYLEAIDTKGLYCPSDTSKTVSNACTPMAGTLEFAAEPTGYVVAKNSTVRLHAFGIEAPATGVRYVWSLPGFKNVTYLTPDSSEVSILAPSDIYGEREVTVTAKAAGYCQTTQTHVLKIVDCIPMEGQLRLTLNGMRDETTGAFRQGTQLTASASGITAPAGLLYEWTTAPAIPAPPTTTNTWSATLPNAIENYVLTAKAKAAGSTLINYCEVKKDTVFSVGTVGMAGSLYVEATGDAVAEDGRTLRPGAPAQFVAKGIANPPVSSITYTWVVTGLGVAPPAPQAGRDVWSFVVPATAANGDSYTVQVITKAVGYTSQQYTVTGTVQKNPMSGALQLHISSDGFGSNSEGKNTLRPGSEVTFMAQGITAPLTGLTYTWDWRVTNASAPTATNITTSPVNSWKITAPGITADKYTVSVKVEATGYNPEIKTEEFIIDHTIMSGNLQIRASGNDEEVTEATDKITLRPGAQALFSAEGITTPADVTYEWAWKGSPLTTPAATTSPTWGITVPNNAQGGNYTLMVTAKAAGYKDKVTEKLVVLKAADMSGTLDIKVNGRSVPDTIRPGMEISFEAVGITKPTNNLTYEWEWGLDAASPSATHSATNDNTWKITTGATGHHVVKVTVKSYGYESYPVSKTVIVKAPEMKGDLTVQAGGAGVTDNFLRPAANITFTVDGVTNPATGVTYDWSVTHTGGESQTFTDNGTTLDFQIPSGTATGSYTVWVTAKATGYTTLTGAKRTFTVAKSPMTGTLDVRAEGISGYTLRPASDVTFKVNSMTTPATGVTYDWSVKYNSGTPQPFPDNGATLDFSIPASTTTGSYTVQVTAKADGYTDKTEARIFTITTSAMTGDLAVRAEGEGRIDDQTLRPASNVTFKVDGVTSPATGVTYDWTVQYDNEVSPPVFPDRGKTLDFSVPSTATGHNYTVWVTAKAGGYADWESPDKKFAISPAAMAGDLSINVTGDGVSAGANGITIRPKSTVTFAVLNQLTQPAGGVVYEWSLSGSPAFTPAPPSGTTTATVWTTSLPEVTGETTYTVKVAAKKDGYITKETTQPLSVTPAVFDGTLRITAASSASNTDGTIRPNAAVEFRATGLTSLPAGVAYDWTWTPASPATTTNNSWTTNTGSTEGAGTVTVTVKADGYAHRTAQRTVTVKKGALDGTPAIAVVTSTPPANQGGQRDSYRPGSQVQFRVDGMANLPAGVTYDWAWTPPTGSPANGTTNVNTWPVNIGTAEGAGTLSVIVKADGYADKPASRQITVQKTVMRGVLTIDHTGSTERTIDNKLCFLPGSKVRFTAGMNNPPAGVTYEWEITHQNSGATPTTGTGNMIDYTAALYNPNNVAGDLLTVQLTAKADGYADLETTLTASIQCFPFIYAEAVPKITYTSGGGSTIYTGADVIFTAPVITDPNNGANATYTWLASDGVNVTGTGTGQQWTTKAPATPTAGFGTTVAINQAGYCEDERSLPGLSVNCLPQTGNLSVAEMSKPGKIYFNKNKNISLEATYNGGSETPDYYIWNIGGQYSSTGTAQHIIPASSVTTTPAGTYSLTVTVMKGTCPLKTVTEDIIIVDCPYTGSDLLIDADHHCRIMGTSSTYYEAYITAGAQTYRIVRLPNTYPSSTYYWWFAENSKLGTKTYESSDGSVYYYLHSNASGACPTGWSIPSNDVWSGMIAATGTSSSAGALCSTSYSGTDEWGFSATNTSFRKNDTTVGDAGAFIWSTGTNPYMRIQNSGNPSLSNDTNVYAATVRCVRP